MIPIFEECFNTLIWPKGSVSLKRWKAPIHASMKPEGDVIQMSLFWGRQAFADSSIFRAARLRAGAQFNLYIENC